MGRAAMGEPIWAGHRALISRSDTEFRAVPWEQNPIWAGLGQGFLCGQWSQMGWTCFVH